MVGHQEDLACSFVGANDQALKCLQQVSYISHETSV